MYKRPEKGALQLPTLAKRFEMPSDIPSLAYDDGVVTVAGMFNKGGQVSIQHANGLKSMHLHLRRLKVKKGDRVKSGQVVGFVYHNPDGFRLNHLHYEMFRNGNRINPEPLLAKATIVSVPGMSMAVKAAISVGIGLLAWKYVFK